MAKTSNEPSVATLVSRWIREIRSVGREWGRTYVPKEDITPVEEVKGDLYNFILENHPDVINVAIANPIFAPSCTWHIIGRDVKKSLEDRGWIFLPNRLDDPGNPFNSSKDVLLRKATPDDANEYKSLEYDLLGPLMDRVERLKNNAAGRLDEIKARREELESWIGQDVKTTKKVRMSESSSAS